MATPDLAALQAQVEQLKKEYTTLTNKPASLFDVDNPIKAAAAVKSLTDQIELARAKAARLEEGFGGIFDEVTAIVAELYKTQQPIDLASKAMKGIRNVTEKLKYDQQGISELSLKELQNAKKKLESLQEQVRTQANAFIASKGLQNSSGLQLENYLNSSIAMGSITEEQAAMVRGAKEGFTVFKKINKELDDRLKLEKKVQSGLGVTGGLLKGISKIPILGNMFDASDAAEEMEAHLREVDKDGKQINSNTSALKVGLKNVKGQIVDGLLNPANLIVGAFTLLVEALKGADKATGDLAKGFNITYSEAANVRNELIEIGNLSGNVAINARSLQESMMAVGQSLGSNAKLNKEDLITFTELREMAGYTNEELVGIQKLTLATGGNLKDNVKQFLGTVSALNAQNKLTVNEKQLLKEVANTSAAIKLSIGGTTESLAKSAFQAKQFGINLQQADQISSKLLDFESSISNELSAELLTGKDLNLEKARLLALNGNISEASAEILKQVGGTAEFTKMNRIQQEAIAAATGLSREELAASLVEKEALTKLGEKDKTGIEAYNRLKKEGLSDDQIAIKLGNEQYANQLKQQSIQERMNQSIEKMKEIFIGIAEPILQIISPIIDILIPAIEGIMFVLSPIIEGFRLVGNLVTYFIDGLKKGNPIIVGLTAAMVAFKAQSIMTAIFSIFSSLAKIPFGLGIPLAGVAVAGMISLASKAASPAGDMYSPADGKTQVSTKEGGLFELSKNDSLMAFPESKIKNNSNRSSSNIASAQQDLSPLLEEMRALRQEQSRSNNKPVIVENSMNGTKFGTSVAMNTYKIQ